MRRRQARAEPLSGSALQSRTKAAIVLLRSLLVGALRSLAPREPSIRAMMAATSSASGSFGVVLPVGCFRAVACAVGLTTRRVADSAGALALAVALLLATAGLTAGAWCSARVGVGALLPSVACDAVGAGETTGEAVTPAEAIVTSLALPARSAATAWAAAAIPGRAARPSFRISNFAGPEGSDVAKDCEAAASVTGAGEAGSALAEATANDGSAGVVGTVEVCDATGGAIARSDAGTSPAASVVPTYIAMTKPTVPTAASAVVHNHDFPPDAPRDLATGRDDPPSCSAASMRRGRSVPGARSSTWSGSRKRLGRHESSLWPARWADGLLPDNMLSPLAL